MTFFTEGISILQSRETRLAYEVNNAINVSAQFYQLILVHLDSHLLAPFLPHGDYLSGGQKGN